MRDYSQHQKSAPVNRTKMYVYGAITIILLALQGIFNQILLLAAAAFALWRFMKLATHGFGCSSCQMKFFFALIVLVGAIVFTSLAMYYALIVMLWFDVLVRDKNDIAATSF